MKQRAAIDEEVFLQAVLPRLQDTDPRGLVRLLRSRWKTYQIVPLLDSENADTAKVAALALALIGCRDCIPAIAAQLRHPDPMVNQMAEHALWSLWFGAGCPRAVSELGRGSEELGRRNFDGALEHFSRAIAIDPAFAEAYNQRAIAHYLQESYRKCIDDCRRAVRYMPCHFGAWAGMGHACAHIGELPQALDCYRRALDINPHLHCVAEAIQELTNRPRR